MRLLLAGLGAALALGPSTVRADATYEMLLRTSDLLAGEIGRALGAVGGDDDPAADDRIFT